MRHALAAMAAGLALVAQGVDRSAIAAFSTLEPANAIPPGWREIRLPRAKPPDYALVRDGGATVLRVQSAAAAGSLGHALDADAGGGARLGWRWKVDRVVQAADLERKAGDDYAARVYVMFDLPLSELPFTTRVKIQFARLVHGAEVPAAALCYVWDNRHAVGTMRPNAYVESVRMVVLESGAARAGTWVAESRNVEADFQEAFAELGVRATPRVIGVAVGNDTDQTGETVTAWFGDLRLETRR